MAYTRVSTADQKYGIGAQKEAIRRVATERGWEVRWVDEPARSGKDMTNRPKLQIVLADLRDGKAQGIIVSKLDRLSRSVRDFADIIARAEAEHWDIVCLEPPLDLTTPGGRMVGHMLAAFAQFERELIGQRIREGLAEAKRSGKKLGRHFRVPPQVARRIHREHEAGMSLHAIARGLSQDGVPTARGAKQWYAATVSGVLKSYDQDGGHE